MTILKRMDISDHKTKSTPTLAIIDDEPSVIRAFCREFHDVNVNIHTYTDPLVALQDIETIAPDVIISDVRMPGMSGIELMERASSILPLSERILLTGYADHDASVAAINHGKVNYYLEKPWDAERLKNVIKKGLELAHLRRRAQQLEIQTQSQNLKLERWNEELESQIKDRTSALREAYASTVRALADLAERRMHLFTPPGKQVLDLALSLAIDLNLSDAAIRDLRYAVYLKNIGKISFSDELLSIPYYELSPEQRAVFQTHPQLAALAISGIKPLEGTEGILLACYENLDGSGYPKGLTEEDINLATQILRVASDACDAHHGALFKDIRRGERLLEWFNARIDRYYSTEVVEALKAHQSKAVSHTEASDSELSVSSLQPGMFLSRDLAMPNGALLLKAGAELQHGSIRHLLQIERNINQPLPVFIDPLSKPSS